VTVGEDVVSVDGIVKLDKVRMITYRASRSTMTYYAGFSANRLLLRT
jgi:hypothetical protein